MASFPLGVNGANMSGRLYYTMTDYPSLNYTTVKADFQVSMGAAGKTISGTFGGRMFIAGEEKTSSKRYSISPGTRNDTVFSFSVNVYHNSSGGGDFRIGADGGIPGTSWTNSFAAENGIQLTTFDLSPSIPSAAPTLTRSSNGTTITITSGTATSSSTILRYEFQRSTDGTTWPNVGTNMDATGTVDGIVDDTGLTATQTYYYQTRAVNSAGAGPWSATRSIAGVTGSVTGYNVSYEAFLGVPYSGLVSGSSGLAFSVAAAVSLPSGATNGLPPGITLNTTTGQISGTPTTAGTYCFRIQFGTSYAPSATTNFTILVSPQAPKIVTGTSPFATSRSVLKVYNGTSWVPGTMRVFMPTFTNPDNNSNWKPVT